MSPSTQLALGATLSFVGWALLGLACAAAAGTGSLLAHMLYVAWKRLHASHQRTMLSVVMGLWMGSVLRWSIELLLR